MATAIRGMPGSEFEPRRPLQKHHPIGWCFFRVRLGAHRRVSRLTAATRFGLLRHISRSYNKEMGETDEI